MSKETIRTEYSQMMFKLNEERKKAGMMIVGGPHFKQERKKMRSSNYTLSKIMKECIDNICYKCKNVRIAYNLSEDSYLKKFSISDDYEFGFQDIKQEGTSNPFNFTHMREGHSSDSETSQFGAGFKAAAASSCELLKVYTQVENKFYHVVCDFPKMEKESIAAFSFDPEIYDISESEYRRFHKYAKGSTIIFEDVRKAVYSRTDKETLQSDILNWLSECYSDIITEYNVNIYVDETLVSTEKDYTNDPVCKPFNIEIPFIKYIDKDDRSCETYVFQDHHDRSNYYLFNNTTKNWNKMTPGELLAFGLKNSPKKKQSLQWIVDQSVSYSDVETECMRFKALFLMYHPDLNTDNATTNEKRYPKGRTRIYRHGRCHGIWSAEGTDGNSNFTDIRIDYKSKEIGTQLGVTWNKDISNAQENDMCMAVLKLLKKIKTELNGNTSQNNNHKLYDKAVGNNISVPEKRLPSEVKEKITEHPNPKQPKATENILFEDVKQENEVVVCVSDIALLPVETIKPQLIKVSESIHTKINVNEGLKILKILKQSDVYDDEISKIIILYCDRCASDQIALALKFMTYIEKNNFLDSLIKERYTSEQEQEEILGGSKLNYIFANMKT